MIVPVPSAQEAEVGGLAAKTGRGYRARPHLRE